MGMPYNHFSREEFAERQAKTRSRMASMELDGLLLFKIEDIYWLCGFESRRILYFQQHVYRHRRRLDPSGRARRIWGI